MLSYIVDNMTALYNAIYYGNSTNFDDNFKVIGKLLASCYSILSYCEGIKLLINEDLLQF